MRRRLILYFLFLAAVGAAGFWFVTLPRQATPEDIAGLSGDPLRGAQVFWAGGCASCHSAVGAEGDDLLVLAGGKQFPSPFGTFFAPNISPDLRNGIGSWSDLEFLSAVRFGTSPEGTHYFPAFPYVAYTRATSQDVLDLRAYMNTLPPVGTENQPHQVPFPFNIRRLVGGWKMLNLRADWVVTKTLTAKETRGRYLAEALGHCGECHTPRDGLGGLDLKNWLGGAPNPGGKGTIPNITPGKRTWTEEEMYQYLTTGFTPEFDTAGGLMTEVIQNLSHLSEADRRAIAGYLWAVSPLP